MKKKILILVLTIYCYSVYPQETGKYIDPRDGKTYKTVKIGGLWLMAENMAYKPDSGGYWAYDNNQKNVSKYGYLYDLETAKKIAPKGWHLPSREEWQYVYNTIGKYIVKPGQTKDEYVFLKMIEDGASGFNALPVGMREKFLGTRYLFKGLYSGYWSSTGEIFAMNWIKIDYYDIGAGITKDVAHKDGISVRLFLDNKAPANIIVTDSIERKSIYDNESNGYSIVKIGPQIWMTENLKTTHYRNGDQIPNLTDRSTWKKTTEGAYCWYNNDSSYKVPYGALYNWYAVSDSRNLCPTGWHVPSNVDLLILIHSLGGIKTAGDKLKATASHWFFPDTTANNISGFSALPGGQRFKNGDFMLIGIGGDWWSSSKKEDDSAWYIYILNQYNILYSNNMTNNDCNFHFGHSVRCLKDD